MDLFVYMLFYVDYYYARLVYLDAFFYFKYYITLPTMKSGTILGLMSGTSLDGLDLCLTHFEQVGNNYKFTILKTLAHEYPADWQNKLRTASSLAGEKLSLLNIELANYYSELVLSFLKNNVEQPDFISSHGHTVFHQPQKGLTLQIGDGTTLFAGTKIPVIYNFRALDVALGGQGAPLVPIGDMHLFSEYSACINFGGIANISYQKNNARIAFDICPVNMALSDLTSEIKLPYDDKGLIAKEGEIDKELLMALNRLDFYKLTGPKSLGIEWYTSNLKPLVKDKDILLKNRLRTMVEHIADQIAIVLENVETGTVLVTGGGVYNAFLMAILQSKVTHTICIPEPEIIEFKEALIFAFLGWLKVNNKVNTLKSVTGASRDSSGGQLVK